MSTFIIKQHDLEPSVDGQLKNADGTAIDLASAAAVYFVMRPAGGGTTIRHPATVVATAPDFVANPLAVHVRHTWISGDTGTVDVYDQEWEIMWPSTRPQTVPNHDYNTVIVEDDLD